MEGGGQNKETAVLRGLDVLAWLKDQASTDLGGSPEGETKTEDPLGQEGKVLIIQLCFIREYKFCDINCPHKNFLDFSIKTFYKVMLQV